ncbi:MAG: YkgJ family cysteine cluster protein [Deltaproteobacteria bacterium]|nr:YkgJ family cysteine cluster protein [Deltaproteobacteria bacterium]
MASPRLRILDMIDEAEWARLRRMPRFLQPLEASTDPCVTCPGNCCMAQIRVTTVEALRIVLTLTLRFEDVVDVSRVGPEHTDYRPRVPLRDGPVVFQLKVTPGTGCLFLFHVGGRGRCSIHGLRPGPCRMFPFHVVMGRREMQTGSQRLCPIGWVRTDALEKRVARDVAQFDKDLREEKRLVDAWVAADGGQKEFTEFLAFAIRRLAPAFGRDAEELLAPPRRRLGQR